jgi:hypothetical protein
MWSMIAMKPQKSNAEFLRAVLLGALLYFRDIYKKKYNKAPRRTALKISAFDFCGFIAIIDHIA